MKNNILIILFIGLSATAFSQKRYEPKTAPSREQVLNREYTSGLFSTPEGVYFDMENDAAAIGAVAFTNVLDWLQGRVAGLQIYRDNDSRIPFIRNMPAAVFVNEIRVDAGFLNLLPVTDIGMIKIMRTPYAMFWNAPGGAIAIYTKRGGEDEDDIEEKK